jgi:hypothetical protein
VVCAELPFCCCDDWAPECIDLYQACSGTPCKF